MTEPPDRYVGSAQVPIPTTAVPYQQAHDEPRTQEYPRLVAPPRRPRRSPLLVAGLIAGAFLLLLFGMLVGLSLGFGTPKADPPPKQPAAPTAAVRTTPPAPKPDSPKQVTEKFLAAAVSGDRAGMDQRLCGLLKGGGEASPGSQLGWLSGLVGYKVGEERVTGLTASVDAELTVPFLGAVAFDVYLIQEAGGWRVCGAGPG